MDEAFVSSVGVLEVILFGAVAIDKFLELSLADVIPGQAI